MDKITANRNYLFILVTGFSTSKRDPVSALQLVKKLEDYTSWFLFYSFCKMDADQYGNPVALLTGYYPEASVYNRLIMENKSLVIDWREKRIELYVKARHSRVRDVNQVEEHGFEYGAGYLGNVLNRTLEFYPKYKLPPGFARLEFSRYQTISFYFRLNDLNYKVEYAFKNIPDLISVSETGDTSTERLLTMTIPVGIIPKLYVQKLDTDSKEWSIFRNWIRVSSNFLGDDLVSKTQNRVSAESIASFADVIGRCSDHQYEIPLFDGPKSHLSNNRLRLTKLLQSMQSYGILRLEQPDKPIPRLAFDSIKPFSLLETDLPFTVLFQLLSMVSQFTINEFDLDAEIIEKLKSLPESSAEIFLDSINAQNKKCTDFGGLLDRFTRENVALDGTVTHPQTFKSQEYGINHRKIRKIYLTGPQLEMTNRIIRTYKHKISQFIRVTFADEDFLPLGHDSTMFNHLYERIRAFLDKFIDIAGRRFEFLHYSNSQLRTQGCWFFEPDNECTPDSIRKGMGIFNEIKNPAKFGSRYVFWSFGDYFYTRMAQCFSSTTVTGSVKADNVVTIDDVERNGHIFSDGVGRVGVGIAGKMIKELKKYLRVSSNFPSAYQFRMGGCKGMLCVDKNIPRNQIQIRYSQRKFDSSHYAIEVCRCSFFSPGYLNRQVITLLESLGVSVQTFMEITQEMLRRLESILKSSTHAKQVLNENEDEYGITFMLSLLIDAGFYEKKDPYLMNLLRLFYFIQDLKLKSKLHLRKSCMLLGVLDESASIPQDSIFVQYTDPVDGKIINITGPVLINRSPCLHPGDIQKVTAVSVTDYPELAHLVDVVAFSQFGNVPLPMKIAGGDLDGDTYLVIWDERLLDIKNVSPMDYAAADELTLKREVTMDDVKNHFINYLRSNNLGTIANTWLAFSDSSSLGALDPKALQLAELHSQAVDFPKKGIPAEIPSNLLVKDFPDYMEKKHRKSYVSRKAIGSIYRHVKLDGVDGLLPNLSTPHSFLVVDGYEAFMLEGYKVGKAYARDIYGLMRQYSIESEYELISGYLIKVSDPSLKRRPQDIKDQIMDTMSKLKKHYRSIFFLKDFPDGIHDTKISNEAGFSTETLIAYSTSMHGTLPKAYYQRASAWYQTSITHNALESLYHSKTNDNDSELESKILRSKTIHDLVDFHVPGFEQFQVPEIPASFGWLMHDVLCSIARN